MLFAWTHRWVKLFLYNAKIRSRNSESDGLQFSMYYMESSKKGKPSGTIQLFIQQKILFFYLAMIDDFPIISNIKQNMVKYKYFVDKKSKTRSIPTSGTVWKTL